MRYKALTLLMLLTFAFGIVVMVSSFPPAMAESGHTVVEQSMEQHVAEVELVSQASHIKLLIGAVGLLFTGYMFWIQRYISSNDKKHALCSARGDEIAKAGQATATSLAELITEHRMVDKLGGSCAIGSNALRETLQEALEEALGDLHIHQRKNMKRKVDEN